MRSRPQRSAIRKLLFLLPVLVISLALTGIAAYAEEPAPTASGASDTIYLDGQNGDDAHDGLAAATAVKTFAKAKEMAAANKAIKTIYVTGAVNVSGTIDLDGTDAVVKRGPAFDGVVFNVVGDTTLSDITIDGNADGMDPGVTVSSPLVAVNYVENPTTLTIADGALLRNNTNTGFDGLAGGGIFISGAQRATLDMTGGTIEGCTASQGGGVYLGNADFTMTGGAIRNNHAFLPAGLKPRPDLVIGAGGGIFSFNTNVGAKNVITIGDKALIQGNKADMVGGGIALNSMRPGPWGTEMKMDGGTIDGNEAQMAGGGIFVGHAIAAQAQNVVTIEGGTISNNRATDPDGLGGAGIYVRGFTTDYPCNGAVYLYNAEIVGNKARKGGGVATTAYARMNAYLENGVSVHGNESADGQEYHIEDSDQRPWLTGESFFSITPIMPGFVPALLHDGNGEEAPLNSLHSMVGPASAAVAFNSAAKADSFEPDAHIVGNVSASVGGGIGTSGNLTFGESDTMDIAVRKEWKGTDGDELPEKLRVNLYAKLKGSADEPVYIGYETMKEDDGAWSMDFIQLPKYGYNGTEIEYSVSEEAVPGYIARVSGDQEQGFTIVNVRAVSQDVAVSWKGIDPADAKPVTVQLLENGKPTGKTLVLSADNGWKATFEGLPSVDEEGNKIAYSIVEEGVEDGRLENAGHSFDVSYDGSTIVNRLVAQSAVPAPAEEAPADEMPDTGDTTGRTALIAVALLGAGIALVAASRKARR